MTWELLAAIIAVAVVVGAIVAYVRKRKPGGA